MRFWQWLSQGSVQTDELLLLSIYHKRRRTQKAKPVQAKTINTLHNNASKTHYIKTQSTIQKQKHSDKGTNIN